MHGWCMASVAGQAGLCMAWGGGGAWDCSTSMHIDIDIYYLLCALSDARAILKDNLSLLFDKIYSTCTVPEQWKVSKIVPIFKKGSKVEIENYRAIENLCSTSKNFEKFILKQIHYLESTNKLDLTGKNQHGFKRNKSTATAGALLQSIIAHAADDRCFVLMASLDLSMAFDLVNTELLVKRLRVMGLPQDIIWEKGNH